MIEHVLLIDDEPDIRAVASLSLTHVGGWRVSQAPSGAEGLALAEALVGSTAPADRVDLVLLDVMMPGLDGPATLQGLRANPVTAGLPVIFLTAKASPADVERFLSLGAAGVLVKPFDPMTLADQVRAVFAQATAAGSAPAHVADGAS